MGPVLKNVDILKVFCAATPIRNDNLVGSGLKKSSPARAHDSKFRVRVGFGPIYQIFELGFGLLIFVGWAFHFWVYVTSKED